MTSQKLVRCRIKRRDDPTVGSVRYVPLEIYGLWEFLMREKHQFEVTGNVASLWIERSRSMMVSSVCAMSLCVADGGDWASTK